MRARHCAFHFSISKLINQERSHEVNARSPMSLGGEPMIERTGDSVSRNGANLRVNGA